MESNDGPQPGHRIAPSARGGTVLVSLYAWTIVTLGVGVTRWIIGLIHKVQFGFDDGMVLGGNIFYTGATACWHIAVTHGLGKKTAEVSDASTYFKAAWAAQLLQLVAMAFAKCSSAFLLGRVAPQSRRENGILFGLVGIWTIYSLLAFGFQCGLPHPWMKTPKCAHGGPVLSVIALNMATDAILAWWIVPILRPLNMDQTRRRWVMVLFGSRAIVPFLGIAQIWAVAKALQGNDPLRDGVAIAILHQTVASLSLIVASLPRIKRFLGMPSGMLVPRITETELALSTRPQTDPSSRGGAEPLKLVPSNSTKFTTTVQSGGSSKKAKRKIQNEWDKFVSMGSKQDDHTSTSSLFDHQGGVVMQQEVTVKVEDNGRDPD